MKDGSENTQGINKRLSENLLAFTEKINGIFSERKRESNLFQSFDRENSKMIENL